MVVAGCQSTQKSFKKGWAASNLAQRSVQKRTEDRWLKVMRTVGVVRKSCPRLGNGQRKLPDMISVWCWALPTGISGIIWFHKVAYLYFLIAEMR